MPTQTFIPTQKVLDSNITALPFNEQIQIILEWANTRESRTICVANVHMLMEAHWNSQFASILENADLVTPDGMPLVWMMRLLGVHNQDRVAGLDIFLALCQKAQSINVSVALVGSTPEILKRMRRRLEHEFPHLKVAAIAPLPFRPLTSEEDEALIQKINETGAGLVFVSLGCPKQESWMAQHKDKIKAVMLGVGGVFPVYAGIQKNAPREVKQFGLEWLYRLVQEPRRLWGRYRKTIPPFIWLAIKQLLVQSPNLFNPRMVGNRSLVSRN